MRRWKTKVDVGDKVEMYFRNLRWRKRPKFSFHTTQERYFRQVRTTKKERKVLYVFEDGSTPAIMTDMGHWTSLGSQKLGNLIAIGYMFGRLDLDKQIWKEHDVWGKS